MKTLTKITIALVIALLSLIIYTQNIAIKDYQHQLNDKNRTEIIKFDTKCLNK